MKKSDKAVKIILITLFFLNLLFIFANSILPPDVSGEESDAVSGLLAKIFPPDSEFGRFVIENVRKIAHFTEFFTLGVTVSLYTVKFTDRKYAFLLSYAVGFAVAFFDETIQIFTGRGPMISDVWLDFFGFASSLSIVYLINTIIQKAKVQNG